MVAGLLVGRAITVGSGGGALGGWRGGARRPGMTMMSLMVFSGLRFLTATTPPLPSPSRVASICRICFFFHSFPFFPFSPSCRGHPPAKPKIKITVHQTSPVSTRPPPSQARPGQDRVAAGPPCLVDEPHGIVDKQSKGSRFFTICSEQPSSPLRRTLPRAESSRSQPFQRRTMTSRNPSTWDQYHRGGAQSPGRTGSVSSMGNRSVQFEDDSLLGRSVDSNNDDGGEWPQHLRRRR